MKHNVILLVVAGFAAASLPASAFSVAPLEIGSPAILIKKGKGHGDRDERSNIIPSWRAGKLKDADFRKPVN